MTSSSIQSKKKTIRSRTTPAIKRSAFYGSIDIFLSQPASISKAENLVTIPTPPSTMSQPNVNLYLRSLFSNFVKAKCQHKTSFLLSLFRRPNEGESTLLKGKSVSSARTTARILMLRLGFKIRMLPTCGKSIRHATVDHLRDTRRSANPLRGKFPICKLYQFTMIVNVSIFLSASSDEYRLQATVSIARLPKRSHF